MLLVEALQRWIACLGVRSTGGCQLEWGDAWVVPGLLLVVALATLVGRKAFTALVTLRAMAWTPTLARRLSTWVKSRAYSDEEFFRADGAEGHWIELRKKAIDRLAVLFQGQYVQSIAWGNEIRESFSDLRFTDANRVPFPFVRLMRENSTCARWSRRRMAPNCATSMATGPWMSAARMASMWRDLSATRNGYTRAGSG